MRIFAIFLAILLSVTGMLSSAKAKTLDEAVVSMSAKISGYLISHNRNRVTIKDFQCTSGPTAGRAIRHCLAEKLKEKNIKIEESGSFEIRGELSIEDLDEKSIVTIITKFVDTNGRPMGEFRDRVQVAKINSIEVLPRLLGLNQVSYRQ